MSETLSSLFQKSQGSAIEVDGQLVWPILREKVFPPSKRFLIRRLNAVTSPVQGLRIKVTKGTLEVNGQRQADIILWADTSPSSVDLTIHPENGCELKAWNVWGGDENPQAWIGNSGMLIHKVNDVVTLECSAGTGSADFTDLIVQIARYD